MKSIARIDIPSTPMVLEYSSTPRGIPQGSHASTMELFMNDDGSRGLIEWDIPTLGRTQHIGVWFKGRTLRDYDGVFSLPAEAVKFLRSQKFVVPADFED